MAKLIVIEDESGNVVATQDITNLSTGEHRLNLTFDATLWQGKMKVYTTGTYPGSTKIKNVSCTSTSNSGGTWDSTTLAMHNLTEDLKNNPLSVVDWYTIVDNAFIIPQSYDGPFTIEFILSYPEGNDNMNLFSCFNPDTGYTATGIELGDWDGGLNASIIERRLDNSGGGVVNFIEVPKPSTDVPHFISFCREGYDIYLGIDGIVTNNYDENLDYTMHQCPTFYKYKIGDTGFTGTISEIIVTIGIAKYKTNFTPSLDPFIPDIGTTPQQTLKTKSQELYWSNSVNPTQYATQDLQWVIGPYNYSVLQDIYFSTRPISLKEQYIQWSTYPVSLVEVHLLCVNAPIVEQEVQYTIAPEVTQGVYWSNHKTIEVENIWEIGYYKDQMLSYVIAPIIYTEIEYTISNSVHLELNWTISKYSTKDLYWSIEG